MNKKDFRKAIKKFFKERINVGAITKVGKNRWIVFIDFLKSKKSGLFYVEKKGNRMFLSKKIDYRK